MGLASWWKRRKAAAVKGMLYEAPPRPEELIARHIALNPHHLPIPGRPVHENKTRFLVEHIRPDGTTDHFPTNDGREALLKWEEHKASPRKGQFIFHDADHPAGHRGVFHRN